MMCQNLIHRVVTVKAKRPSLNFFLGLLKKPWDKADFIFMRFYKYV